MNPEVVVVADSTLAAFRERARAEAGRYGSDPWVFVRELLQNARDAGARRVTVRVDCRDQSEVVTIVDDGEGMSFAEARRFLFTLYASSKDGLLERAGRFGVGFWSVLRFDPARILVRSRPAGGEGWELDVDAGLRHAVQRTATIDSGTEVVLERAARDDGLERLVFNAARAYGRFLTCRDQTTQPLEVTVNSRAVNVGFGLPPPSVTFERPGLRGAVALARDPGVELFAYGLQVRTAPFLDDLLVENGDGGREGPGADLAEGLVPRVLLDSHRLQVLMARSEAREDRELRRLVRVARSELGRLVRDQLDRCAPQRRLVLGLEWVRRLWSRRWLQLSTAAAITGIVLGSVVGDTLPHRGQRAAPQTAAARAPQPYTASLSTYSGPSMDGLHRPPWPVDLRYHPASEPLFLAARLITGLAADGSIPRTSSDAGRAVPYSGLPCTRDCIEIDLAVHAPGGLLRLPVPTGHTIDPSSVEVAGRQLLVVATEAGEAAVVLEGPLHDRIRYRTGVASQLQPPPTLWPALPAPLFEPARELAARPPAERVAAATHLVRQHVAYDRSPATAARHREAQRQGLAFTDRALAVGAGDCDVQNAVLATVLASAAVPSRLAIGYVGRRGTAMAGLHAWVEYMDELGRWQVADASIGGVDHAAGDSGGEAGSVDHADPTLHPPAAQRPVRPLRWPVVAAVAVVAAALVCLWASRNRTRRRRSSDGDADLPQLLRGALRQPEAFAEVRELFTRDVVPVLGGRAISLHRARRLAGRGALYQSAGGHGLGSRAARRGATVVDASRSAGLAVAELLGATDLDHWDEVLGRSTDAPWSGALEDTLRQAGEVWTIRAAAPAPAPLSALSVPKLGVGVVVIDRRSTLAKRATATCAQRPALASLVLADAVTEHLDLPARLRRRLLARLARHAIAEKAQR